MTEIFVKYPNTKKELLVFYDKDKLNPYKLQQAKHQNKNKFQSILKIIPKDYEQKLKKLRVIYDDIWMLIKLKPLRTELIHFFLKQQDLIHENNIDHNDKRFMKIDLYLIRYSVIRMIVFHIKRVVWMKHFIFH